MEGEPLDLPWASWEDAAPVPCRELPENGHAMHECATAVQVPLLDWHLSCGVRRALSRWPPDMNANHRRIAMDAVGATLRIVAATVGLWGFCAAMLSLRWVAAVLLVRWFRAGNPRARLTDCVFEQALVLLELFVSAIMASIYLLCLYVGLVLRRVQVGARADGALSVTGPMPAHAHHATSQLRTTATIASFARLEAVAHGGSGWHGGVQPITR